jgi:type VI secretion system protein ImpH
VKPASPLERLATEPQRFGFDAAIRVLLQAARTADPGDIVRFRSVTGLAYPPADILGLHPRGEGIPPDMVVSVMGLTGPSGVLPRGYTETLNATLRSRSAALHDFLDMLSHRMVALFARAATKYRPSRIAEAGGLSGKNPSWKEGDPFGFALLSLTGYGTAQLAPRMAAGAPPLMHYAGSFASHPRSADRLQALVSDWLGQKVEVRQFVGAWLKLPPDQQTRLSGRGIAGQFDRLGFAPGGAKDGAREDASIGVRAWDVQAGVVLRIGPLARGRFNELLPDRPLLGQLVALVRAYLGFATGFAINLVVAAPEVPPLQLRADADPAPRLGWNSWLHAPSGNRRKDAADAVFEAEVVEAQMSLRPNFVL